MQKGNEIADLQSRMFVRKYNRQHYAEKIAMRNGNVAVKIIRTDISLKRNSNQPGLMCVHIFFDKEFKDVKETHYTYRAKRVWNNLSQRKRSRVKELNDEEFKNVMTAIKNATLIEVVHLKKKAQLTEEKLNVA